VTGNISGSAGSFTGSLVGDVTGTQSATAISATTVTGKALTGYVSGAGTVSATDSILSAINKLNGNDGLKANLASPTFTGTVTSPAFSGPLTGNVTGNVTGSAGSFTGSLVGDVTGTQGATAISAATVTGKALTGYVSGAGTIAATDTILGAINKLNGNDALKANLASPTFTGTVSGITATMVGLGNVTNTADASKPVSTAQQAALDLKANLASPTFTGTVSGITASMVGLGNVGNTSDANKPVSTAQQTALNLKANLASPTFSGTVVLPTGTSSVAPLKFATGTSLTTAVFGSVEFDGTNLYLTNNSASPTRKTLAFTDSVIASVSLASLTAAPLKPVVAWGNNHDGQTTLPTLANVAAVAAGDSHSLVLLDGGTVVAWGLNTSGQTTIPGGLTGVTEIAAGTAHNLVRKSDGTLVAWGNNTYAQTTIPSGITTATKVAAGEKHSLALLANGTVRAWGDNGFGQTTLPSGLTGATITAIAAGYDHCLALKSDGTVISWGRDDAGQVTLPIGLSNVVAIAAGAYHSLALKSDGTVIAWGWDGGGQVTVPASLSGVTKIAGGYAFSMALKSDGTLVLWGDNTDSQTTVPSTATQVTHIAAGASHALALRADAIAAQVARLDQDNVFTGKVGIKRTPATNSLEVEGTASKTTAGSWLANSDRRIKTEIQSITGALEKLDQVRLVDFRYTDEYRAAHPSIEDVRYPNVIAQEFATVFPDDVKSSGEVMPDGSPILQVDTYPLTIYAAAAVQELHRENRELKKKIADQDRKFADQESRLRRLEEALGNK
jgi:alpha-tubulin suppressor-like RCC1 family protein